MEITPKALDNELEFAKKHCEETGAPWNEEADKKEIAATQLNKICRDILSGRYVPEIPSVQLDEKGMEYLKDLAAESVRYAIQELIKDLDLEEYLKSCLIPF